MNNYQLYRTNVKLGGQVSWNLVVDNVNGDLVVKYFDLTPISPYVNYKYGQNRDCLNYTHQENLRDLFKQIKGQFYDACINPQLKTKYPIIDQEMITRDPSLEMGVSRIKFNRYNKQFQVFCPVWLENFSTDKTLSFDVQLCNIDNGEVISSKTLTLDTKNIAYHDKFVSYWRKYVSSLGESIGDDLLNVNLTDKFASITGLDILSGDVVSKDISEMVPNMYERERPLMETDYILIDNYHTSTMIAKQLFNFNIVLDITDLTTILINKALLDNDYTIRVDVKVDDKELTKKAFDCDYSKNRLVKKGDEYVLESGRYSKILSYLRDYDYTDTIHENKLDPDICHWTLKNNTDYIFNLYQGFSTKYPYFYADSPDYWSTNTDKDLGTILPLYWTNHYVDNSINSMFSNIIAGGHKATVFDPSRSFFRKTMFDNSNISGEIESLLSCEIMNMGADVQRAINNIKLSIKLDKYLIIDPDNFIMPDPSDPNKELVRLYVEDSYLQVIDGYELIAVDDPNIGIYSNNPDKYIFLCYTPINNNYVLFTSVANRDQLAYKNISQKLAKITFKMFGDDSGFSTIQAILSKMIEPKFIYLYNTLLYKRAEGPWLDTKEIEYIKNNNVSTIVIRYDGKIKPAFCDLDNVSIYRVKKMTPEEFKNSISWQKDQTQGYAPNYPSVEYFNLELTKEPQSIHEYKWFDEGVIFNVLNYIDKKVYSKNRPQGEPYYNNDELVEMILGETYPNLSQEHLSYLKSIYSVDIDYEYDKLEWNDDRKEFNYIYNIKLKLK